MENLLAAMPGKGRGLPEALSVSSFASLLLWVVVVLSQTGTSWTFSCNDCHHVLDSIQKVLEDSQCSRWVAHLLLGSGSGILCQPLSRTGDWYGWIYIKSGSVWKQEKGLVRQNNRCLLKVPWYIASEVLNIVTYSYLGPQISVAIHISLSGIHSLVLQ